MIRLKTAAGGFLWFFVVYLLGVILFGAWVRITHSGAGCGSHWPTCHGQIIPIDPSIETIIEFSHRLTSGALGILGIVFLVMIFRKFRWTSATKAAVVTLVLIVFEALIGAGIVLKELVQSDDSVARAVIIAIHLVNTLFLTGSAAFASYRATMWKPVGAAVSSRWFYGCIALLLALVASSMTGAVTALGDTLFPVELGTTSMWGHVTADLDPANHFLVRLRIVHPIVAVVAGVGAMLVGFILAGTTKNERVEMLARLMAILAIVQLLGGLVNVGLAAPGWMQIIHLLFAQLLWIAAALLTVELKRSKGVR